MTVRVVAAGTLWSTCLILPAAVRETRMCRTGDLDQLAYGQAAVVVAGGHDLLVAAVFDVASAVER